MHFLVNKKPSSRLAGRVFPDLFCSSVSLVSLGGGAFAAERLFCMVCYCYGGNLSTPVFCTAVRPRSTVTVCRFQVERVKRCTRVQELAAEGSGLPPEVTQGPNVSQLSSEERSKRYMEFTKWIAQYPNNQGGDPKSVYWK